MNNIPKGIQVLKKHFDFKDEHFIKKSNVTYKVLVPISERYEYISKIMSIEGFKYDPNIKGSSIGALICDGVKFLLKPINGQGRKSSGCINEDVFNNTLNSLIDNTPTNVTMSSDIGEWVFEDITTSIEVGYDVTDGKKADSLLVSNSYSYPISLKQDNAGFWESSDSRYRTLVSKLIEKIANNYFYPNITFKPFKDKLGNIKEGIKTMFSEVTGDKITGIIVTDLPTKDNHSVVFGSDNAQVVYKTFTPNDFEKHSEGVTVSISKFIQDKKDLDYFNLNPVINIRHDSTRTRTSGLRATVIPYNKAYNEEGILTGNKVELSYNEIMK